MLRLRQIADVQKVFMAYFSLGGILLSLGHTFAKPDKFVDILTSLWLMGVASWGLFGCRFSGLSGCHRTDPGPIKDEITFD